MSIDCFIKILIETLTDGIGMSIDCLIKILIECPTDRYFTHRLFQPDDACMLPMLIGSNWLAS